jgi:hypothetical protein
MGIQWMMCWWVQVHCDLKLTGIWLSFILIIITILRKAGASSAVWNSDTFLSHCSNVGGLLSLFWKMGSFCSFLVDPLPQCWWTFDSLCKDGLIVFYLPRIGSLCSFLECKNPPSPCLTPPQKCFAPFASLTTRVLTLSVFTGLWKRLCTQSLFQNPTWEIFK